jgi:hypothetical protein
MAHVSCGESARQPFAGMAVLTVSLPDGSGYRIRYLDPPWERIEGDALARGEALLQWGGADSEGDTRLPDLRPIEGSVRILEIERSGRRAGSVDGIAVYPKYRLEAALLRCDVLDIAVPRSESCARVISRADEANRASTERSWLLVEYVVEF